MGHIKKVCMAANTIKGIWLNPLLIITRQVKHGILHQTLLMNAFKSVIFFRQCGGCFFVVCVKQREFCISWVITH